MTAKAVELRHPHEGDESYQRIFSAGFWITASEGVKTACKDR